MSNILVVGSVAYDSISTPEGKAEFILGGSANYFSLAASMYSQVNVVGIVGEDYRDEDIQLLKDRNVDLEGLQKVSGKTFHWEGKYEEDMNEAITLDTQLNVFENFDPVLPESYKNSKYVFLANIDPDLQMSVLDQIKEPRLVGIDTMNFWIDSKMDELKEALKRCDVLLLNEGEAKKLAGESNTVKAIQMLTEMGPRAVVVKRGEYGFMLHTSDSKAPHPYFILPAYPVANVTDPTGAGDTFAGGFFGYLSKLDRDWDIHDVKEACVQGCLLASATVEKFGVDGIAEMTWPKVEQRHAQYQKVISR